VDAAILAAGRGTRLGAAGRGRPKGFIQPGPETLIDRSVRLLFDAGVRRIVIGTGHEADAYRAWRAAHPRGRDIELVHSERYETTGSAETFRVVLERLDGPALLLESDLLYEARALATLLSDPRPDLLLASGFTGSGDEVFVQAGRDGRLEGLSKDARQLSSRAGELVGITKLSADAVAACRARSAAWRHEHYEAALVELAPVTGCVVTVVPDLVWCEVDDENHLERARTRVLPRLDGNVPRHILLNPGPCTTTDAVKTALLAPDVCPREDEFCAVLAGVREELVRVLALDPSEYAAVPLAGSATAAMEAAIASAVAPGGKLAVAINGAYGERMAHIADCYGIPVVRIGSAQSLELDVAGVERALAADPAITAFATVHHETTSGIRNPVERLLPALRARGVTTILDATSSYGALPIAPAADGIDLLFASSNKCLHGMPGLSFVIGRRELFAAMAARPPRGYYLDLGRQYRELEATRQMPFTPPVQVVYALARALDEWAAEGGQAGRFERYSARWEALVRGLDRLGLRRVLPRASESRILTSIHEPDHPGYSFSALHDHLKAGGVTVYPGKLAGRRTFRLAVMGDLSIADIEWAVELLAGYLRGLDGAIPLYARDGGAEVGS
jgi:2-aminoethylphosphonate-pyruvate transaminase